MKCVHDLADMETACMDGRCPICLAKKLADLQFALKGADCGCTVKERMSGHRIGCWRPDVNEILDA